MFAFKKKYFLIIENIKDIELKNIKIFNKFSIIYRNFSKPAKIEELLRFRMICKRKKVDFYISNNLKLAVNLKADGLYISANNNDLSLNKLKNIRFKIIGSAHNIKEVNIKLLQGCSNILFSRLFKTSYKSKPDFLGIIKYNLLPAIVKSRLTPLGGIRLSNLNKLKMVGSNSFALLSEVKKKPAITSRLF